MPGSAIRCGFLPLLCGSAHAEGNRGWWAAQCHEVTRFLCLVALFHCSVVVRGHGLVTVTQAFRIVAGVMTGVRSTQQRPRGGSQILLASTLLPGHFWLQRTCRIRCGGVCFWRQKQADVYAFETSLDSIVRPYPKKPKQRRPEKGVRGQADRV